MIRRPAKDKGYRSQTIKLRKILRNGLFVGAPFDGEIQKFQEPFIKLWRAVVDQWLKDIISHHLVKANKKEYNAALLMLADNLDGKGQEVHLAFLNADYVKQTFDRVERTCLLLKEKGLDLK